ncbi:MAG: hypothetical protein IKI90_05300 [Treponema sp.]|nr:hypothetical protein [Treponema sp.]
MKGIKLALIIAVTVFLVAGCASGSVSKVEEDEYPSSIADIDAISLGEMSFYGKSMGKLKQHTFSKVFVEPRYNTVELHYRDGMNTQMVILNQGARVAIVDSVKTFVQQWDDHTLQNVKATAKNAYSQGKIDYSFGVVSAAHSVKNIAFYMNCIFVDGQPYLVMRIPSREVKGEKELYSPYTELYFSRTQAESLAEVLDQSYLEQLVHDKTDVNYSYE